MTREYDDKARKRFAATMERSESGCWEWRGHVNPSGYGTFGLGGKVLAAHRVALEMSGVDVDGLVVMHTCDNRSCVNPSHLAAGTRADNNADKAKKGRGRKSPKGVPFGARRDPKTGRWQAAVRVAKEYVHLGMYATAEEASHAALAFKSAYYNRA